MSYSFDIKNSKDLFHEFCIRSEQYRKDPISSGGAVICAILSWHIVEWLYQEHEFLSSEHSKKRDFQNYIKKQCPSLSYMQDIANGSKHRGISNYTPVVKDTRIHQGAFSSGFSNGFDISSLKVELDDGTVVYFDEEIEKVEFFFKEIFKSI